MAHPLTFAGPHLLSLALSLAAAAGLGVQAFAPLGGGGGAAPHQPAAPQDPAQDAPGPQLPGAREAAEALERAFRDAGVQLDHAAGVAAFRASIAVRDDLLEYLLVNPHGAVHEALFVTQAPAEVLNAALLALGAERGTNVAYVPKDPPPSEAEQRAGVRAFDVVPPQGAGVYLYAAWREDGETYFYRVEDLVRDLERGRTLRRHAWVYLGSRWNTAQRPGAVPQFAATAEGNLVCITFFSQGNTLLTTAVPECVSQTTWLPNGWLLPEAGAEVQLFVARAPLLAPPASLAASVPAVTGAALEPPAGAAEPAGPGR